MDSSQTAHRSEDDIVCRMCGYSLARLQVSRCPECGNVFNLDDRSTYVHKDAERKANQRIIWTLVLIVVFTYLFLIVASWAASILGPLLPQR
jgi:hypothetical protein